MNRNSGKKYIGAFLVMLFALLLNISGFAAAKYEAAVKIPVRVTLEGEKASSEEVTIVMTPLDGATAFDQTSIKVQAKKGETVEAEFTKTFKEPVDLRYEIRETAGTTDAYTYDDTVYTAIVFVENDPETMGLKASVVKVYKDDDPATKQDAAIFINRYCPAEINPPVNKVVTNDSGTAPDTAKFHFTMKAEDKTFPMPVESVDGAKTVEAGTGKVEFGKIEYEKAGTYTYKVYEEKEALSNFTYDTTEYTVKAVVEKKAGKLTATMTITKGTEAVNSIEFNNHYAEKKDNSNNNTPATGGNKTGSGGGGGGGGSSTGAKGYDPGGSVLGAVRDAIEDSPVGQVLGAARDKIEESPVGQVLGAVRGATRTGDNSFMMISGLCFLTAIAVLTGWIMTFLKRRMS
ncbi:MAG: hypothetical protein IJ803_04905 [Oribacterium sp.]|nr:hypothetical protein [Oribacterium sp.]